MNSLVPVVDLSIDFDFFVREMPEWDFSHNDVASDPFLYKQKLWMIRYATHRLYTWTRMEEFADFLPEHLFDRLLSDKGLRLGDKRSCRLGVADSHRFAFEFFHKQWRLSGPPNMLLNIDAHHDCYAVWSPEVVRAERIRHMQRQMQGEVMPDDPLFDLAPGIRCDNWLTYLYDHWQTRTAFVQLYPQWKPLDQDKAKQRPIAMYPWKTWPGLENAQIRHIFLCRSPEWVPPHHDPRFFAFLSGCLQLASRTRFLEQLCERSWPTESEAEAAWQAFHQGIFRFDAMRNSDNPEFRKRGNQP